MAAPQSIHPHRSLWDFVQPTLDAAAIIGSLTAVKWLTGRNMDQDAIGMSLIAVVIFLLTSQLTGVHRRTGHVTADREIISILCTWILTVLLLAFVAFATRFGHIFARSVVAGWIVMAPCSIALGRMLARIVQRSILRQGIGVRQVAIAGLNELGLQTALNIDADPGLGLRLAGFFDDRELERIPASVREEASLAGNLDQLVQRARRGEIDSILITLPMRAEDRIRFILDKLSDSTVSVYIVPDFFVFELLSARWTHVGGLPAVSVFENPLYGVDGFVKRVADLVLTIGGLIVAAFPMLLIAAAIKLTSPGPVFFRQRRYGLDGREIRVWKFRSMHTCEDGAVIRQATHEDPRITTVGAFLRRSSLDELPQLFNVLEGSMSLVGPRPHATAHNEQYRRQIHGYMLRHKVKPGITGLAQVSGCRGETDTLEKMQRRVEYDHQYIRRWSLWLDLKILVRTVWVAWRQPEAY